MAEDIMLLVNENDEVVGYGEKMDTHVRSLLHRAFSIFIYDMDTKSILLQKRAEGKYHSGGLWTNSCCSHPRKGETMAESVRNRLKAELGLETDAEVLEKNSDQPAESMLGKIAGEVKHAAYEKIRRQMQEKEQDLIVELASFQYLAPFEGLSEHEIDHVFLYSLSHESASALALMPDPEEISELDWVTTEEIDVKLAKEPESFTAWFPQAYSYVKTYLEEKAE